MNKNFAYPIVNKKSFPVETAVFLDLLPMFRQTKFHIDVNYMYMYFFYEILHSLAGLKSHFICYVPSHVAILYLFYIIPIVIYC